MEKMLMLEGHSELAANICPREVEGGWGGTGLAVVSWSAIPLSLSFVSTTITVTLIAIATTTIWFHFLCGVLFTDRDAHVMKFLCNYN